MQHIILVGFMGSGKSTLGLALSRQLSMPFVDTDQYIETKKSKPVSQIFKESGEEQFRLMEREALAEIIQLPPTVIATGGGMPCFFDNMDVMNSCGTTVYMYGTPEVLAQCLSQAGNKRPLIAQMSNDELPEYVRQMLAKRETYYSRAKIKIEAHSASPNEMAARVCKAISDYSALV